MALTGIIQRRNLKAVLTATPPIEGEIVYATDTDEFGWLNTAQDAIIWTNFETPNSIEWGNLIGDITLQEDLITILQGGTLPNGFVTPGKSDKGHIHNINDVDNLRIELDNRFLESDFIITSAGSGDAGKPVLTNNEGFLDNSLVSTTVFTLIGNWTPDINVEYPIVTNISTGDYYLIANVDISNGYTYTTGDLVGKIVFNSDQIVWGTNGWLIVAGNVNPDAYVRRDGTAGMFSELEMDSNKIVNLSPGQEPEDAVNKFQTEEYSDTTKSVIQHSHDHLNGIEIEYEKYDSAIQGHLAINSSNTGNPHFTDYLQITDTPSSYLGHRGKRATVNDTETGLIFEPSTAQGMFTAEYIYDNTTTEPVNLIEGELRRNNTDATVTTELYVSGTDNRGVDRKYGLDLMRKGDLIGFYDAGDGSFNLFRLNDLPNYDTTYDFLTFPVTFQRLIGGEFTVGDTITVEVSFSSAKFFEELQDVPGNPIDNDLYIPFEGASNQYLKVTAGDLTNGTGVEYKALEINDIGFDFSGDGLANSTLQTELNEKLGGIGKILNTTLEVNTALITNNDLGRVENILKYSYTGTGNTPALLDDRTLIELGENTQVISLNATIFDPLKIKNNTAIQGYNVAYDTLKNLISRTAKDTNTNGDYNEEIVVGDSDVQTVIRSTTLDPAVRKGIYGSTTDYKIHTDEDFTILQFTTTEALAVTNEASLVSINSYVGIDDTTGLSLRISTNELNIGTIGDLTTTATDLVEGVNEVKSSSDTHSAIVTGNPHNVTKEDIGLSNVENYSADGLPLSTASISALALKWDGTAVFNGSTGIMELVKTASFKTELEAQNLLSYTDSTGNLGIVDGQPIFTIGEINTGLIFDGRIVNNLVLQNNIAIQSVKDDGLLPINLISRSNTSANAGTPTLYNNDVTIGADQVLTVIRDSTGFEAAIRAGADNSTIDYPIYSTRDFDIAQYTTTGNDTNYENADAAIQTHILDNNANTHNTALYQLVDVNISTPVINNDLSFNGTDWINNSDNYNHRINTTNPHGTLISNLGDVDLITLPTIAGDVLEFDGTNWIPISNIPLGGVTTSRPVDPVLYTTYWDTDINVSAGGLIICTDNTNSANIWKDTAGTIV